MVKDLDLDFIEWINREGVAQNKINPFEHGSQRYTHVMKTEALKQALDAGGYDAAFGGARRDEEKSRAKERVFSLPRQVPSVGSEEPATRSCGACSMAA